MAVSSSRILNSTTFVSLFVAIHAIVFINRAIMLKSCLSFTYKTTTTTRRPGQFHDLRTLFILNTNSPRETKYKSRKYTNSQRTSTLADNSPSFASTSIMPKRKKVKFYAVAVGRNTGIYSTWAECQSQVKGFSNAKFKSFSTIEEAESFVSSASNTIRGKSGAAAEIETYSDIAVSINKKKRARVVATDISSDRPTPGSKKNPIQIEYPHAVVAAAAKPKKGKSAAVLAAAESASSKPKRKNTNDADGAMCKSRTTSKKHPHKVNFHVMFDGGSRGNPHGHAGSGTYILTRKLFSCNGTTKMTRKKSAETEINRHTTNIRTYLGLGMLTNNQAEYTGLVTGLKEVSEALEQTKSTQKKLKDVIVFIQGDSDLIVKQMNGIYACKSPKLKSYYNQSKDLVGAIQKRCKTLGATCNITFEHVYRENNTIADGLANEAMDAKRSWVTSKGDDDDDDDDNNDDDSESEQGDNGDIEV